MRHETFGRPVLTKIRLVKDCHLGKAGQAGDFTTARAESLVKSGFAEYVAEVENKAVQSEPVKRGPGRPRKIAVDDKAIA